MPKTLTALMKQAKNKLEGGVWIELYRIDVGGGIFLTIANHTRPITYQSVTYDPFVVEHEVIQQDQEGKIPQLVASVENVTRTVQGYLEAQDGLRGKSVTIKLVHLDATGVPDGDITQAFVIDSVVASAQVATFVLSKPVPAFGVKLPGRIVSRELFPALPGT